MYIIVIILPNTKFLIKKQTCNYEMMKCNLTEDKCSDWHKERISM